MSPKNRLFPVRLALALAAAALCASAGRAQTAPSPDPESPALEDTDTPRATVSAFLSAAEDGEYARAAEQLDFTGLDVEAGSAEAAETAEDVHDALDRLVGSIDLDEVSDDPAGEEDDGPEGVDLLARIDSKAGRVAVRLVRSESGDWRFGPEISARAEELLAASQPGWLEDLLPEAFFRVRFLTFQLWQWLGLLLLVAVASFLGLVASAVVQRVLRTAMRRTKNEWDDALVMALAGPLRLGSSVAFYALGALFLALPIVALKWIATVGEALIVLSVAWFLLRTIDIVADLVRRRIEVHDASAAGTLVPLGRRVTKVFVALVAAVSLIHNLGFNVAALLGGLGVGALAVALAAQKTLENLFGGFSVIADRPVRVGEACKVGEHEGTVEDIGLRSTRIRTADRTLVTIPNSEFSTVRIENLAQRDRMKLTTILQFAYDTSPDQLRYLLVELRRLLYAHPKIAQDGCRARFVNFGASSLDVELFAYVATEDAAEFLAVREDVFLRIMDLVAGSGASFAFPSQTLYLGRSHGRDPERSQAAEEKLAELRRAGGVPLPEFTPEEVAQLGGTLPWPPEGSAQGGARKPG
jgi:MscS family membrane protein